MADASNPPDPNRPEEPHPEAEGETYDLDLPEDESEGKASSAKRPAPSKSPRPTKGSRPSKPATGKSGGNADRAGSEKQGKDQSAGKGEGGGEAYELEEPIEDQPRPSSRSPTEDPRAGASAPPPGAAPTQSGGGESAANRKDADQVKSSVYTPSNQTPQYVDPDVASTRREEYRKLAAQEAAAAHVKRQRTKLILTLILAAVALGVLIYGIVS